MPRPPRPKPNTRHLPHGLAILYEDEDILVVDKPPGLLTIGTDDEKERTVYYALTDYVRKGQFRSTKHVYVVHRLDREASGILVFAKGPNSRQKLQDHWPEVTKTYLAVIHGHLSKKADTITSFLTENKAFHVYATTDPRKGLISRTAYKVLKETKIFSLLEINLLTGRKHQIRVHLADTGHPIVGDRKYGEKDLEHKRLALHALSLSFKHPYTGEPMSFTTPVPDYFASLVGEFELSAETKPAPEAKRPRRPDTRKARPRN